MTDQNVPDSGLNLDHLEALARAATAGPWLHRRDPGNPIGAQHCVKLAGEQGAWVCDCIDNADRSTIGGIAGERNAGFIAAANPAAVLELIALARRAAPVSAPKAIKTWRERARDEYGNNYGRFKPDSFMEAEIADLRAALANQPAPTVPAGDALIEEAGKLAPILRGMCEGGDVHGDGVDIYADDYMAGDGDTYVVRAAALLEQVAALAHQPAQEQAERPSDDDLWDQTIKARDHAQEMADKLAEAIAKYFDADIGEHSNMNCPWHEALDVIDSWAAQQEPVAAPQQAAAPGALYSYMGESGRYELIGQAVGAGKCRLIDPLTVYRDTATDSLYFRHPGDFAARMVAFNASAPGTPEAPADPLDTALPCDIKVGNGTIRKGCKLRALVAHMESMHRMALAALPVVTPEQRAEFDSLFPRAAQLDGGQEGSGS